MRRIMVLGGSGFIGRQCIKRLLGKANFSIHGVSRHTPAWAKSSSDRLRWHTVDLLDIERVSALFADVRASDLLHLGWYAGHGRIWTTPENLDWAVATLAIARAFAATGGERIVIAGSCAEYGGAGCFEEQSAQEPETLYGVAKNSTRQLVAAFASIGQMSFAWPRLFHMYGPHENERRLVSGAIISLLNGREFECSDGAQIRDFLHVEDVSEVLTKIVCSDLQGVVNVGSGAPTTIRAVLETVGRITGRPDLLKFGARPRALNDPNVLLPNVIRQTYELGWRPKISLADGLDDTVRWWSTALSVDRMV